LCLEVREHGNLCVHNARFLVVKVSGKAPTDFIYQLTVLTVKREVKQQTPIVGFMCVVAENLKAMSLEVHRKVTPDETISLDSSDMVVNRGHPKNVRGDSRQ